MGCGYSRGTCSEEAAVVFAEAALGFAKSTADIVDCVIRKHSIGGYINVTNLMLICQMLNIHIENYSTNCKIHAFFHALQNEYGQITLPSMLALGVLLSAGPPELKGQLLFHIFEDDSATALSMETLRDKLFEVLITLSIKLLNLVTDLQTPGSNEIKALKYAHSLTAMKHTVIRHIMDLFETSERITEKEFTAKIASILHGTLTTATGWRLVLNAAVLQKQRLRKESRSRRRRVD